MASEKPIMRDGELQPPAASQEYTVSNEPETDDHSEAHASPRGAFLFVMLMLTAYAIYWVLIYSEVVFGRGG